MTVPRMLLAWLCIGVTAATAGATKARHYQLSHEEVPRNGSHPKGVARGRIEDRPENYICTHRIDVLVRRVYRTLSSGGPPGAVVEAEVTVLRRGDGPTPGDLVYARSDANKVLPVPGEPAELALNRDEDGVFRLVGVARASAPRGLH